MNECRCVSEGGAQSEHGDTVTCPIKDTQECTQQRRWHWSLERSSSGCSRSTSTSSSGCSICWKRRKGDTCTAERWSTNLWVRRWPCTPDLACFCRAASSVCFCLCVREQPAHWTRRSVHEGEGEPEEAESSAKVPTPLRRGGPAAPAAEDQEAGGDRRSCSGVTSPDYHILNASWRRKKQKSHWTITFFLGNVFYNIQDQELTFHLERQVIIEYRTTGWVGLRYDDITH